MRIQSNRAAKHVRILPVILALLVGAVGCQGESADIVMPENPKSLPNPQDRLTVGEETPATSIEIKVSE